MALSMNQLINFVETEIVVQENEVETCIDNWDELCLAHPLVSPTWVYSLIPELLKLDGISKVYIARNGLLRCELKEIEYSTQKFFRDDVALHIKEGEISLIKTTKKSLEHYDYMVFNFVANKLRVVQDYIKENFK